MDVGLLSLGDLITDPVTGVRRSPGLGGFDFDTLISNTAMCGSPAEVIDRMGRIRETLRLDTQILMCDMGGMPDFELFECIGLIGSDIIPAVARL